jgi:hypothetical protein
MLGEKQQSQITFGLAQTESLQKNPGWLLLINSGAEANKAVVV